MERIYRQPRNIKLVAWLYLALTTPVFFVLAWEFSQASVEDKSAYIFIPLLFLPFYLGACWVLWRFRGYFVLTDDGITLKQSWGQTFLRYQDISSFDERDSQFLPYLLLVTPEESLSISFKVDNFSDLYANLRKRISAMRIAESASLPLMLRFRPGYIRDVVIGFSLYAIFTGVLSTGMTHNKPWPVLYWLGAWSIFILIAGFVFWLNELTSPYRVDIVQEQIEAHYLFGKTRTYGTREITRIERERQVRRVRYNMRFIAHPIVITFENGERLQLEEGRIWSFGYSPDRLLAILKTTIIQ